MQQLESEDMVWLRAPDSGQGCVISLPASRTRKFVGNPLDRKPRNLECVWVASSDFRFLGGIKGVSIKPENS